MKMNTFKGKCIPFLYIFNHTRAHKEFLKYSMQMVKKCHFLRILKQILARSQGIYYSQLHQNALL